MHSCSIFGLNGDTLQDRAKEACNLAGMGWWQPTLKFKIKACGHVASAGGKLISQITMIGMAGEQSGSDKSPRNFSGFTKTHSLQEARHLYRTKNHFPSALPALTLFPKRRFGCKGQLFARGRYGRNNFSPMQENSI